MSAGPTNGDCCSYFTVRIKKPFTLGELFEYLKEDEEWGSVHLLTDGETSIFSAREVFEFGKSFGKQCGYINSYDGKMDSLNIVKMHAYGGWGNMNYWVWVKPITKATVDKTQSVFKNHMELKAAHWAVKHLLRSLQRNGILLDDMYMKRNKPYDEKKHSDALYYHFLKLSLYDFENAMNDVDPVPILWSVKNKKGKVERYRVPSKEEIERATAEAKANGTLKSELRQITINNNVYNIL